MEFIKNGNLYDVLQNSQITDEKLFKMIEDICHGMNYLHNKNVLHLDLKPMNLLVDENLTVKGKLKYFTIVCDFGLSKTFSKNNTENSFTGACGTILYMAPVILN
jgi:serine/threonine protein kinase